VKITEIANYAAPTRLGLFLAALLLIWLPIAAPIYLTWREASGTGLAILVYCEFIALIWLWGRKIEQKARPYTYYGLVFSWQNLRECIIGIGFGLVSLSLLMLTEVSLGWLSWRAGVDWQGAVLPGLLTGIGAGFAEELLFRGWLLTELDKDYGKQRSLFLNSGIFALLHINFANLFASIAVVGVQLPGLILLGMDLVWAKRAHCNRLGLAIGLHGGLIWGYYIANTTKLFVPNQVVPEWVTGIGGNPLAGVMGLLFLGAIAFILGSLKRA
jgi:membrane protease YdiL (CAAX protease family)